MCFICSWLFRQRLSIYSHYGTNLNLKAICFFSPCTVTVARFNVKFSQTFNNALTFVFLCMCFLFSLSFYSTKYDGWLNYSENPATLCAVHRYFCTIVTDVYLIYVAKKFSNFGTPHAIRQNPTCIACGWGING